MKNFKFFYLFLAFAFVLQISSCVKGEFDEPSTNGEDPNIAEGDIVSLNEVLAKYVPGQIKKLDLDKYLKAVVVADDASGSFYKTLVVKDDNSDLGISVIIDENNLAAKFPIGRRIFINLADLWVSDYNGLPQIGYSPYDNNGQQRMSQIPSAIVDEIISRGQFGLEVLPTTVSDLTLLGGSKLNTLIKLENVQFGVSELNTTYADAVTQFSLNKTLEDCNGNEIIVRNSGFASFAGELIPSGNGSLVAIYTIFGSTRQLVIRDLNDVTLTADRCGGNGGIGGSRINVKDVRSLYNGTPINGTVGYIEGVVISDFANGNITGRNAIVQDETAGIAVRFDANHPYKLGDKVQVSTNEIEISEFNGTLQLNNVPLASSLLLGSGTITPKVVKIGDLIQDFEDYESTLVKIETPTITGGTTFAGNLTLTDNSGTLTLFTRTGATFANEAVPATVKSVIGIVGEFTNPTFTPQLSMRNIGDIDGEGGGGPTGEGLDENFNGGADNMDIDIANWVNVAVEGSRRWQRKTFDGDSYAQATAYNDTAPNMEAWLITAEIDATKYKTLSFETAQAFHNHDGLTVWATNNYTGDTKTTVWTQITATLASSASADHAWVKSGNVDIATYGTNARIGFKYVGAAPNNTTSYRLDKIKIQ